MEIKDYITKNLPNLNWNILPQIFEENDVELTEEIEAYLRNTPWNTNWNIIHSLTKDETNNNLILDWTFATSGEDGDKTEEDWYAGLYFSAPNFNPALIHQGDTLLFEIMNGEEYINTTTVVQDIYNVGNYIRYRDLVNFSNTYKLDFFSNDNSIEVNCSKINPFPNAQDAWILPARSYDYSNTKIKITNLGNISL